jgi:hypothetical protein
MANTITSFAGQNWLITPAALAVGEKPPASITDQKFLLVLSGVAVVNLEGNSTANWLQSTISLQFWDPYNTDLAIYGPLNWASGHYSIPNPVGQDHTIAFSVEEWAPFASLSSIFDQNQSINSGFAVEVWRPTPFSTGTDALSGRAITNIFAGIDVDLAVRDSDAWILRVGYNVTLIGKIVFPQVPIIN